MPSDAYSRAQHAQQSARRQRRQALRAAARRTGQTSRAPLLLARGSPSQRQGQHAEARACAYLESQGAHILARNLHCRTGEIDIVAHLSGILIFIEVRQRLNQRFGGAAASVNRTKQTRLIQTARYFLPALGRHYFSGRQPPCRFDVISLQADQIVWIQDAFRL